MQRAGLTPNHIDVPDLLKLTDPAVTVPLLEPRPLGGGVFGYDSPVPEFRLYRAQLSGGEVELPGTGGPRIVLCVEGTAVLRAGGGAADDGAIHGWGPHGAAAAVRLAAVRPPTARSARRGRRAVHRRQRPLTGAARLDGNRQMVAAMITKV